MQNNVFHQASYTFKYQWVKGNNPLHFIPDDNFILNILTTACAGVLSFSINDDKHYLEKNENILLSIKKGEEIIIKNDNTSDLSLLILYPKIKLSPIPQEVQNTIQLLRGGHITKRDNRLHLLFEQLLDSTQVEPVRDLAQEIILLKISLLQIQSLIHPENPKGGLNNIHHDKIILAKEIIEQDLSKNYTIPELAKLIGTNVQYLKKHFKQHFNQTILSYSTERKMVYAKELILTGNYRVADVARMTGYKHSTHFTTAFKRYYGFIPNSLRQQ